MTTTKKVSESKPTKRMFLAPQKTGRKKEESSEEDSSSSDSDDSSDDSSSEDEEDDDDDVSPEDDDDNDKDESESEEEEDEAPLRPKKGHKVKNTAVYKKAISQESNKSRKTKKKSKKWAEGDDQSEAQTKKKRKSKWTDSENLRLVDHVRPNYELLTGKFKHLAGKKKKDEAWIVVAGKYLLPYFYKKINRD